MATRRRSDRTDADIDSDVEALAYIRYFDLAGRVAQAQVTGIFGGVGGTVSVVRGGGRLAGGWRRDDRTMSTGIRFIRFRAGTREAHHDHRHPPPEPPA